MRRPQTWDFPAARAAETICRYIAGLCMSCFVMDYDHNAPDVDHLRRTHLPFYKIIREAPDLPIIFVGRPDYETWLDASESGLRSSSTPSPTPSITATGMSFTSPAATCSSGNARPLHRRRLPPHRPRLLADGAGDRRGGSPRDKRKLNNPRSGLFASFDFIKTSPPAKLLIRKNCRLRLL